MFNAIRNRFNWQSRKIRAIMAVAICAAGLGISFGSNALLAQLTGGNPTPETEGTTYTPCANLVQCSDASCWLGCIPGLLSTEMEVPDGTFNKNGYTSKTGGFCGQCFDLDLNGNPCGTSPNAGACNNNTPG